MPFQRYFEGRPRGGQALGYALMLLLVIFALSTLLAISFGWLSLWCSMLRGGPKLDWDSVCVQTEPLAPMGPYEDAWHLLTPEYRQRSADLLSGAVQIPTESFDDMDLDPRKEPRFRVFKKLHAYLAAEFPLVTRHLERVNTYGLLYTLKGKNQELASDGRRAVKPVVLMAHQDVVPVERSTLDQWTHGAFSGHFDGTNVWGRGTLDTKNSLVAILEAAESLLAQGWQPYGDVLLSFGFDEELDGSRGALALADTLRERYGTENSIGVIVDEGTAVSELSGKAFGLVSVSEKGYTDIELEVHTPGGHSSNPPDHTGIGIMSELLTRMENTHLSTRKFRLTKEDIVAETYQCVAKYSTDDATEQRSLLDVDELRAKLSSDRFLRPLISTTQAIDVIRGGVKINALPESVAATVNYRIDVHESVGEVTQRVAGLAKAIAKQFGLGVELNGETLVEGSAGGKLGQIVIRNGQSIEPAPVAPFDTDSMSWSILGGSTRYVLEHYFSIPEVVVAPVLGTGNTDTWRYHGLTDDIYRYTVGLPDAGGNAHTVDEWVSLDSHLATVVWYYQLMQYY